MYYASEAAASNWPGEPESDPTSEVPLQVPGKELSPTECLDIAFKGVLKDRFVEGGMYSAYQTVHGRLSGWVRRELVTIGSSTACLMTLNNASGVLRAAKYVGPQCACPLVLTASICHHYSLGDSGFYVIRGANMLHAQKPQTHFFNCPLFVYPLPYSFPVTDSLND